MAVKKPQIKATNAEYVNMAYEQASPGLRAVLEPYVGEGIPLASYDSMFVALTGNPIHMNEFLNLMNMVAMDFITTKRKWNSPLKEFEKTLEYGDTIREIAIRSFQSHTYKSGTDNKNPGDVFKQEPPDVMEFFHKINFERYWENTDNYTLLRRAFSREYGLSQFQMAAMTTLYNSAEHEVYQAMLKAMKDGYKFGRLRAVQIADVRGNANNAKNLVKIMRRTATDFGFYKSDYNVAEVDTFTPTGDIFVFITPDVDAEQAVEVLSAAYNMDKSEFVGNVRVVDSFGDTGIQAIMMDRETLMFFRTLYRAGSVFDERHLSINHYLHYHGSFTLAMSMNAVVFTTNKVDDPTVTQVTVNNDSGTVKPGTTSSFTATVTGDDSNSVFWGVVGCSSNDTYINDGGTLYVGADERNATKLKVVASARNNTSIQGTKDITVQV